MSKALLELKAMNLENRNEATAAEIAEHMGKVDFDRRVAELSTQRFNEIINAYRKRIEKEAREDKAEYAIAYKDKTFLYASDHYLMLNSMFEILIEALRYGSFRISNESSCHERAMKAKADLLLCLAEMGSPHAETLSGIVIEETAEITLDEFIDSKRTATIEVFTSYRKMEHSADRFDRIFSKIKKSVKIWHSDLISLNTSAIKKGEQPSATDEMIEICRYLQQENKKQFKVVLEYWEMGQIIHDVKLKEIEFLTRMNKILPKK